MGEITVILLLALIFLGPSKLPDLAASLGKLIREIRKATSDVKNEIVLDDTFRRPFEELRDAVTLPPEELKRRDQVRRNQEEARKREEEAAKAAAAAAMTAAVAEPAPALPAETPAEATSAAVTAPGAEGAEIASQTASIVPPVAPPAGTVARNRPVEPAAAAPMTPAEPPHAPVTVPAPPVSNGPRVVPPVSSLDGDRANVTQALSEADLLSSAPPPTRRPTPPPLPGLSRAAATARTARLTPPAGVPAPGPNTTQVLSENDLLPPGSSGQPGVKPPPVPEPKKT